MTPLLWWTCQKVYIIMHYFGREKGRKDIPLDSVYSSDNYAHFFTYR